MDTSDVNVLKLNEIHVELISDFLKMAKLQNKQRMKSISYCFDHVKRFKIHENEAYTSDEVVTMIQDLQDTVESDLSSELADCVRVNVLLLRQLLVQAEEWHLTLTTDVAELEDMEKLNEIKKFEKAFENFSPKITVSKGPLVSQDEKNLATGLKMEVVRLTGENDILKSKLKDLEGKFSKDSDKAEKESHDLVKLQEELEQSKLHVKELLSKISNEDRRNISDEDFESMESAVANVKQELKRTQEATEREKEKLKSDLSEREQKLRQVQSNLLLAEKELEKKFQATGAYANLKKILVQKNNVIKELRNQLDELGLSGSGDDVEKETEVAYV